MARYIVAVGVLLVWALATFVFLINPQLSGRYLAIINLCVYGGSLIALWNSEDS